MKYRLNILVFLTMLCFSITVSSQTINDVGKIVLGVSIEDFASKETHKYGELLKDRLVRIASSSGFSSFESTSFYISPNIVISDISIAEGGMKNIFIVSGDLYIKISDRTNGTVFASSSYNFRGSGTKREKAIKNALQNIRYDNLSSVFEDAKKKILAYYKSQINAIYAKADACVANGKFEEAITILMMIPEDLTELHSDAMNKAQVVYNQRNEAIRQQIIAKRNSDNRNLLTKANNYMAMHQPQEALKILWHYQQGDVEIDAQYSKLVSEAETLISTEEKEALRKQEREYQDQRQREAQIWAEMTKETLHRRNLETKDMDYRNQFLQASERVAHHQLSNEQQKIIALKQIARDYLRNNFQQKENKK